MNLPDKLVRFMQFHDDLAKRVVPCLLRLIHPVDQRGAAELIAALNKVTQKGEMPSFSNAGARAGYIQKRFASRSSSIAAALLHPDVADVLASLFFGRPTGAWSEAEAEAEAEAEEEEQEEEQEESQGSRRELLAATAATEAGIEATLSVASIGGAAGEAAFAVMVLRYYFEEAAALCGEKGKKERGVPLSVNALILDYEEGWRESAEALLEAMRQAGVSDSMHKMEPRRQNRDTLAFERCDVLQDLSAPINAPLRAAVNHLNIFIFSYVLVENSKGLEERSFQNGSTLLSGVLSQALPGSVFLFLDSSFKLWDLIVDIAGKSGVQVTQCRPRWDREVQRQQRLANLCNNILVLKKVK